MKMGKLWTFAAMVAILGIVGVLTACDDGGEATHIHNWSDWQMTIFPTETTDGEETRTCSIGNEVETRILSLATFQSYFYGTWGNGFDAAIVLAEDSFTSSTGILVNIIKWNAMNIPENAGDDLITNYPNGFRLDFNSPYEEYRYAFFLNKDGQSIWLAVLYDEEDRVRGWGSIYYKQ